MIKIYFIFFLIYFLSWTTEASRLQVNEDELSKAIGFGGESKKVKLINNAINEGNNNSYLYYYRGLAHHYMLNYNMAEKDYKLALEKGMNEWYIKVNLAVVLREKGLYKESLTFLADAIIKKRKKSLYLLKATLLHYHLKNFKKAEICYNNAIKQSPRNYKAYLGLAQLYYDSERYKECNELFKKMMITFKNNYRIFSSYAFLLAYSTDSQFSNITLAEVYAQKAVTLLPGALSCESLALVEAKKGNFKYAIELQEKAISTFSKEFRKPEFRYYLLILKSELVDYIAKKSRINSKYKYLTYKLFE